MDIEVIRNWAATVSLVVSAASVIFIWIKTPGEKVKASINEVADRVTALSDRTTASISAAQDRTTDALKLHDRRIQKVEDDMRHLPTKDDLHQIASTMKGMDERVSHQGKVLDRIDEYLREHR